MTRRGFVQTGAAASAARTPASRRPNVLFLMADQLRYDGLGANGNSLIRTPNLDRLAQGSANFSHCFVQAPVCVPSRISYFTGRYPHSHRNRVNYTPCDPREVLMQKRFQDAGYQTGSVGKLHLYPPTANHARSTGFHRVLLDDGVRATDRFSDYVEWRRGRDPLAGQVDYNAPAKDIAPGKNPFRLAIDAAFTPTAWTGGQARAMLRDFSSSSKPFFLNVSFFKPHSPHTVPPPFDAMYDGIEIPLPDPVTREQIGRLPEPVQRLILRGRPVYDMDRGLLQWIYRSYYGGVSMVDREIGGILDELDRSGQSAHTIVVLCTDHGDQLLEHGLQGKNVFFEHSVRLPLLVRLPGRISPRRYPELVETVDVMPTLLELCGIDRPVNCQGVSFAPLVTGSSGYQPKEAVFAENIIPEVITSGTMSFRYEPGKGVGGIRHPDCKMVRTRRWKYNYYPGHGAELYDMENDPGEKRNLAKEDAARAVVAEMKDRLVDWLITADETDQIAPQWLVH
jgi:arylsulfatase A-like enzyme